MNGLQRQFRTFITAYAWWRHRLTLPGKAVTVALAYCLPSLAVLDQGLMLLFAALAALLLVTGTVNSRFRPVLKSQVSGATTVRRGDALEISIEATSASQRPAFDLEFQLAARPDVWQIVQAPAGPGCLIPAATTQLSATLRPLRRGLHALPDLVVGSTFPLGLFRAVSHVSTGRRVTVLPDYRSMSDQELSALALGSSGDRLLRANRLGDGEDYLGSREYVPGLPVRRWDYASWARLGRPVVREFSEAPPAAVAIVVDGCFPARQRRSGREIPQWEATLSLVAGLSEALLRQGNSLELLAVGATVLRLAELRPQEQLDTILHALALAEAVDVEDLPQLASALVRQPPRSSLVCVVLQNWNPPRQELCNALRTAGCQVRPLVVHCDELHVADAALRPVPAIEPIEQVVVGQAT